MRFSLFRTTNTNSHNDAVSEDHILIRWETGHSSGRVRVKGFHATTGDAVAAAAPFITYRHNNCPSAQGFYPRFTVYPAAEYDQDYAELDNDRPFQVGGIIASSNDGNGLPSSAGLTWKTGALAGMDTGAFPGDAPSALPAGVAFSLNGIWKVVCNINVDGLRKTGMRLHIIMKKVNAGNTSDDTAFYAESAEAAGGGHEGSRPSQTATAALPTNIIHDFATTARIETPWTVFDPDDVYYIVWGFIADDETPKLWRLSQAFIEFQKRGS